MGTPWLSVIMPVRNGAAYLRDTLNSVEAQRAQGFELLIFDSSPGPECRMIVEQYSDRLPIRYVALPDNYNWPEKTNMGVATSCASHNVMLHSDDIWLPGHLETIAKRIAAAPEAVLHIAPARLIDALGRDIGQWSPPLPAGLWSGEEVGRRLIVQNFIAVTTPIIRRDAWLACDGIDTNLWYTGDWDFYLKLAKQGPIAVADVPTTAFRIHGGSMTVTGSRNLSSFREQLDMVLARHGAHFGAELDPQLRARAQASIAINCALASAAAGTAGAAWRALLCLVSLGPANAIRYLLDSRIYERVIPRIRARLAGGL